MFSKDKKSKPKSWCEEEEREVPRKEEHKCCQEDLLKPSSFTISSDAVEKLGEESKKKGDENEKTTSVNKEKILSNLDKNFKATETCFIQNHEKRWKLTEDDFSEMLASAEASMSRSSQITSGDDQREEYLNCLKENKNNLLKCEPELKAFHEVLQERLKNIAERRSAKS